MGLNGAVIPSTEGNYENREILTKPGQDRLEDNRFKKTEKTTMFQSLDV